MLEGIKVVNHLNSEQLGAMIASGYQDSRQVIKQADLHSTESQGFVLVIGLQLTDDPENLAIGQIRLTPAQAEVFYTDLATRQLKPFEGGAPAN